MRSLTTTPSQPSPKFVLDRANGLAFHYSDTLVDFASGQLFQIQPIFLNQFVINHKIGVHLDKYLDFDSKFALSENLRLEFSPILRARRPGKCFKRRQARKEYPGYPASEPKVRIKTMNLTAIFENLDKRESIFVNLDERKVWILFRAARGAPTMSAIALIETGEFFTFLVH